MIDGRTEIDPSSPSSLSVVLGVGGKTYDVPFAALPFIGCGLDSSLFDVSALLGKEPADRIPVQIRYSMTTIPRLPGITIVASGGDASGATRTVPALHRQHDGLDLAVGARIRRHAARGLVLR
jgi:hypothetical protein